MMRKITPHIRGKPIVPSALRIERRPEEMGAFPGEGECKSPPLSYRVVRAQVKGGIRGPDPPLAVMTE